MEPKTIVAIEIASSKIKGAVGCVGSDGRLSVLAVESIPATNNVRYGRVQNTREVSAMVNELIRRLEEAPTVSPRRIGAAVISMGGRSLAGIPAKSALKFPAECEITDKQVQRLAYEAAHDFVGDKNVEATVPRMFYVNNSAVRQPVGIFGEAFRGEFVMLTCGRETRQNLERLRFDTLEPENIQFILRPLAVADFILASDERELGTVLVDFGAETTTISIYKDGTLAFLSTLPMGSRLITLDLMAGLGMTEEAAEALKYEYSADPENADKTVAGYIRSRAGEIAANVQAQLERAGYSNLSKIVLTGGGSKLHDFATQLTAQTKLPVRVAEMPNEVSFRVAGRNNADNIDIISLMWSGVRRMPAGCLIAEVKPEPVYEPEPEPEPEPRYVEEPEPEREPEPVYVNKHPDYYRNGDNLLEDDPDPEEYVQPQKKRGFLGIFGRKEQSSDNGRRQPERGHSPSIPMEEMYEPEQPVEHKKPEDLKAGKKSLDSLIDRLSNIFTPPGEVDDNDNE